jgi:hypothetical protein
MDLKQTLILAVAPAAALANILQLQSQLPACSVQCLSEGADMFGCTVTDLTCMCSKVQDMTAEVAPCMVNVGDCELEEILRKFSIERKEGGVERALTAGVVLTCLV